MILAMGGTHGVGVGGGEEGEKEEGEVEEEGEKEEGGGELLRLWFCLLTEKLKDEEKVAGE